VALVVLVEMIILIVLLEQLVVECLVVLAQ
jgi:hypothetical protein